MGELDQLRRENEDLRRDLKQARSELESSRSQKRRSRRRLGRIGGFALQGIAGPRLHSSALEVWDAWSGYLHGGRQGEWPENATRQFAASLLVRLLGRWLVLALLALIPLALLGTQTCALLRQTDLIAAQTTVLDAQGVQLAAQTDTLATQLKMATPPEITLEPEDWVEGRGGVFEVTIRNAGVVDLREIGLVTNTYFAPSDRRQKTVFSLDIARTLPSIRFERLARGEERHVTVDVSEALAKRPDDNFCFVKLNLRYRRDVDGRRFSQNEVFLATDGLLQNIENESMELLPGVQLARELWLRSR